MKELKGILTTAITLGLLSVGALALEPQKKGEQKPPEKEVKVPKKEDKKTPPPEDRDNKEKQDKKKP